LDEHNAENFLISNLKMQGKYLRDLIVQQARLSSNEADFAVYSLAPSALDIAFESDTKLDVTSMYLLANTQPLI
jgi:hypothetical protein